MQPIDQLPCQAKSRIRYVLADIDDTLTVRGRLHSVVLRAMERLRKAQIAVVPVTGRPAGWCDHIARMWPVDGVVGESGAFYFWYDADRHKLKKRFLDTEAVRLSHRRRLRDLRDEILSSVAGSAVASDQDYREADLAIDYAEDVAPLGPEAVEQICALFREHGAHCKVSSIHVNGWFGDYDKLRMTEIFVRERFDLELNACKDRFLFCGDSPNDEPMFRYFPCAVGVSNIRRFAEQMRHLPPYVTRREGGAGFAEMVDLLLS